MLQFDDHNVNTQFEREENNIHSLTSFQNFMMSSDRRTQHENYSSKSADNSQSDSEDFDAGLFLFI